ncbi:MBOAT family O-acyltransferase [Herbiconiux ginsengi]|uniref:Alginate O-acetyltransferase complex protein AlgI n=1 Tax=Herbiconiux ginsengi TaxID=381665 RepID=A0A1H3SUN6_9MICO|nr:MBOAT family protein [Herbiconiux ginsengi]SDZ41417.1 alginate O-acetyltransferase complex protein AlgI [Herbiconiux ginsengi]
MSFASPVFLWYFLPAFLVLLLVLPKRWRNGLVAVSSLLFYTWGAGEFVFLLLACMAVNYAAGIAIDAEWSKRQLRARKWILIGAIVFDIGILATWKYAGFFTAQAARISEVFGFEWGAVATLALPIGISFYTFHHMSYVIDVYREHRVAQKSPVQFITYIAMFPQLIAGPIVRYNEISEQLSDTDRPRLADISHGLPRFALGLSKKVIIADSIAPLVNAAFATPDSQVTTAVAWFGAIAYTLQIYFDFSGYTDMAIGLGQMMGFRLPENFNRPYSASSITDFWRRWHMSLSRWFRDYVYIPLGGNRHGTFNTYRNLALVFLLTGFWHGASWTFVIWGAYHGALMVVERLTGYGTRESTSVPIIVLRRILTLLFVIVGWVIFRAQSISQASVFLKAMFWPTFGPTPDTILAAWSNEALLLMIVASLTVFFPREFVTGKAIEQFGNTRGKVIRVVVIAVLFPYALISVASGTFSPFLYFQF